uniref:Uncharacterized protein n=1 Tax=Cacopsylla melanoneura TaxID=428564 RepID=A0A8D8XH49_9HEMI
MYKAQKSREQPGRLESWRTGLTTQSQVIGRQYPILSVSAGQPKEYYGRVSILRKINLSWVGFGPCLSGIPELCSDHVAIPRPIGHSRTKGTNLYLRPLQESNPPSWGQETSVFLYYYRFLYM